MIVGIVRETKKGPLSTHTVYSAVTTSPIDGKIYVYWEKSIDDTVGAGCDMVLTTLTIDWVTDGQDTWKPPNK